LAVKSALEKAGARINFEGQASRITLSYPIKKEREAHFGYFQFEVTPDKIKEIDEELKNSQEIIRFLTITPGYLKNRGKPQIFSRPRPSAVKPAEGKSLPLSNEALEKKIEEILK